jgi:hypothetical protein
LPRRRPRSVAVCGSRHHDRAVSSSSMGEAPSSSSRECGAGVRPPPFESELSLRTELSLLQGAWAGSPIGRRVPLTGGLRLCGAPLYTCPICPARVAAWRVQLTRAAAMAAAAFAAARNWVMSPAAAATLVAAAAATRAAAAGGAPPSGSQQSALAGEGAFQCVAVPGPPQHHGSPRRVLCGAELPEG